MAGTGRTSIKAAGVAAALVLACYSSPPQPAVLADSVVAVKVECYQPTGEVRGRGSGFIYRAYKGGSLVVTAAHVVDFTNCLITINGTPAQVLHKNTELDVAILASMLSTPRPLYLNLSPALGAQVTIISYPISLIDQANRLSVSVGHILEMGEYIWRVSAQAWWGSSGGPVFDQEGRVVGILVQAATIFGFPVDGHYYIRPSSAILETLKEGGL